MFIRLDFLVRTRLARAALLIKMVVSGSKSGPWLDVQNVKSVLLCWTSLEISFLTVVVYLRWRDSVGFDVSAPYAGLGVSLDLTFM